MSIENAEEKDKLGVNKKRGKLTNNKKTKAFLFALILLIFAGWVFWGNVWITTSHYVVADPKIPQGFEGFTIAQISDLHNKEWGNSLIKRLKKESPDVIVITGDLIDSNHMDLKVALTFAQEAREVAPVFFVTGNHEAWSGHYSAFKQGLIDIGVTVLEDEATTIEQNGDTITLLGLMDPAFTPKAQFSYEKEGIMTNILSEITTEQDGYRILLSHRPETFSAYVQADIDLVLAGHAHGGQARIPLIGGVVAPDQGFFPDFSQGLHEKNNTRMIVSRGLGNSIIPIRINNNPELVILRLEQ